ncbi:MAG: hypothetical protein J6B56_03510 [Clostridia bacterium]|nr:hypothetical protein [Clostridia bacterium]
MIDIHTHVLPDLDDGAKGEREAERLLQSDFAQGVRELVFTPHYYGKKRSLESFLRQREEALEKIRRLVPAGMKTRLGAEVWLTGVNDPSNETLCALAIEGTKCVLVELPFEERWNKGLLLKLFSFIADTGYQPIIAHIERYREIVKNPTLVNSLVKMGCLIQLNTGAFLGRSTQKLAFTLLKHGLVHCLGTDAHDETERPPDYKQAKELVKSKGYFKEWTRVQTRMRQILKNQRVENTCTPIKKVLWWYK